MLRILARSVRTGIATLKDPFAVSDDVPTCAHRGFPLLDTSRCTACADCVPACPTGALQVEPAGTERRVVSLSYGQCIGCGECLTACPEQALARCAGPELVAYTREQLTHRATFDVATDGRGSFAEEAGVRGPSLADSAAALRARIHRRFGRSLHVRQVDAGSCNGCELEIAATANPVFDLERFGIHFVASPRHADLLLVTGPVTRNMELALRRTLDATPEPRIVVAVGACGCSGGLFGEGTHASIGGVDRVVPVDVYVPGCPPSPRAIIAGLLTAMGIRAARARPELREPADATAAAADPGGPR